jgi:hypothetical protein
VRGRPFASSAALPHSRAQTCGASSSLVTVGRGREGLTSRTRDGAAGGLDRSRFGNDRVAVTLPADEESGVRRLRQEPPKPPYGLMHLVRIGPGLAPHLFQQNLGRDDRARVDGKVGG